MSHDKSDSFSLLRYAVGGLFILLALFVFGQLLSLLFIENVVDRAARSDGVARIPIYVRLVGIVATELPVPLNPNGSNWPFAFRVFFALQMCGLAGLCVGLTQIGAGIIGQQRKWIAESRPILIGSCLAILIGFLSVHLI